VLWSHRPYVVLPSLFEGGLLTGLKRFQPARPWEPLSPLPFPSSSSTPIFWSLFRSSSKALYGLLGNGPQPPLDGLHLFHEASKFQPKREGSLPEPDQLNLHPFKHQDQSLP